MPGYTGSAKNLMLDALTATITHVGLLQGETPITTVTGDAGTDVLSKATHGLNDGDVVILASLAGGSGLFEGDPYYVRDAAASTFKLSRTAGGPAIDFTTAITSTSVIRLTECSGGSPAYTREAIAWNAAADGSADDSTNGASFDVPGSFTAEYVGYYTAVTAGTLRAIGDIPNETFTGQGTYTLTDADLNLNNS